MNLPVVNQKAPAKEEEKQVTNEEVASLGGSKKNDFTFKVPTKLLSSTIGKSDTQSSNLNMLSYKFTKEKNFLQLISYDPSNQSNSLNQ